MKLLAESPQTLKLEQLIADQVQGDYVYTYPPRQAYTPAEATSPHARILASLESTKDEAINLYIHFPFCKQICKFCNLYALPISPDSGFEDYVAAVIHEIKSWAKRLRGRRVDTIYLGGGTPSLLSAPLLARVLASIGESFAIDISGVPEVALEVAPDTVDATKLRDIRDVGITRINIGLQSANEREIKLIGRQHGFERARRTIEDSLNIGFRNVCVDLIYGLPGQSVGEWVRTLDEVLKLAPPTVCAYPLTLRPGTGFSRQNLNIYGPDQYQKYEIAKTRLQDVGYAQETHVRYIVPGHGGYRQKMNHWAGQDVIGIGAGARGYLRTVDYRNGYSLKKRKDALTGYYSDISAFASPIHSAMNHNRDERLRRSIILGLFHLDRGDFVATHGTDVIAAFSDEFFELDSLGLVQMNQQTVSLTEFGRKYRDLVVQRFFSNDVWERVRRFNYNE